MPKFADIVGQRHIKEYLKNVIATGKVSHAYIIGGERLAGKEFLARIFAQTLQCEQGGTEPCGVCHSCRQAESRNHPDIIYINRTKASIGVDEVREQLCDDVSIRPYNRPYKIYIINEAERLTVQAQNAILKTLEEPPEYVVIMLLTASISSFLPTIRSRCVELEMKPVPNDELKKFLMEEMEIPDYKADVCVAFAQGNVGKAREMAKSEDFTAVQEVAINLVRDARETEISDMIELIQSLSEYKVDPQEYLDIITVWYRDILLFKATGDTGSIVYTQQLAPIRKVAERCSYEGIETVLEAIRKAKSRLNANVNFELTMELLMNTIQELG